jgi:hypothetical protein
MTDTTAVEGATIELGDITLRIADLKKPSWYGDYHGGKLAVYLVTETPAIIPACTSIAIIFTDESGEDHVMTGHYEKQVTMEAIVAHIQATVIVVHAQTKSRRTTSSYVPGPDTLQ